MVCVARWSSTIGWDWAAAAVDVRRSSPENEEVGVSDRIIPSPILVDPPSTVKGLVDAVAFVMEVEAKALVEEKRSSASLLVGDGSGERSTPPPRMVIGTYHRPSVRLQSRRVASAGAKGLGRVACDLVKDQ